ncbi:peptidase M76 family-domain-containing protein [Protomyces lactucae-debilis]|uniref:Mitochondrial inner membrane protease ATP23 n=1 Tax=Protomyces lactucae-debilis TaxID=2754530 RepID=A0A1Y2EU51_PROLT|nr:peptidase M76 family-domain-containing protein [Protomyces lactucae-debilis]ORY75088.1 peptidase M76 family-domain-containing protein [Protomyces lactucae-debilis]
MNPTGSPLEDYKKLSSFDQWLLSMNCLVGRASPNEQQQYRAWRDETYAQPMLDRCNKSRDFLLSSSPGVLFMLKELDKVGCGMTTEQITCGPCLSQKGGFHPDRGIRLCSNQATAQAEVEKTLMHELVHAFDRCRFKVDWRNPKHHACSEIRAASLSGECGWWREYKAGNTGVTGIARHHQACVRRRAARAVAANPAVKNLDEATFLVNSVFDSCFQDTRPFERIY